jgi:small conductance mechanosensitive channel
MVTSLIFSGKFRRADLTFAISYDSDIKGKDLILSILNENPKSTKTPPEVL